MKGGDKMAQTKTLNLVASVEDVYKKLPALAPSVREFIVTITPWLALIFGVLGVLASLSAFGLSAVFSPFAAMAGGVGLATGLLVAAVLGLVESVMMLVASPSLFKRKMAGWNLMFWSEVVAVVAAVISFSVVGVLVSLIAFYFLFQIKSYYK